MRRRTFLGTLAGGAGMVLASARSKPALGQQHEAVLIDVIDPREDIFHYVHRVAGAFDDSLYKRILGAANDFKEGDEIVGIAAANDTSRNHARELLGNTRVRELDAHPVLTDQLSDLLQRTIDREATGRTADLTVRQLKRCGSWGQIDLRP